jgi:hypothetical protein
MGDGRGWIRGENPPVYRHLILDTHTPIPPYPHTSPSLPLPLSLFHPLHPFHPLFAIKPMNPKGKSGVVLGME